MIVRRDVLRLGGAALAVLGSGPGRTVRPALPAVFFYDERLDASRAAAARMTPGTRRIDTGRDIASLWYGGLREEVGGMPLAGCTAYADLVVMQGIAREERRRMSLRPGGPALWYWSIE